MPIKGLDHINLSIDTHYFDVSKRSGDQGETRTTREEFGFDDLGRLAFFTGKHLNLTTTRAPVAVEQPPKIKATVRRARSSRLEVASMEISVALDLN